MCSGSFGVAVNAGGGPYLDAAENSWDGDTGFTGGAISAAPFKVIGTGEQGLYNTRRVGANFGFDADADSGGYTLTLMFADPVMTRPGMRIFNVFAEGKEILKNFDLVAAAGPRTACSVTFPVTIADDELNLQFQAVKDNTIISAIELTPLPIAPAQPSALSATANASSTITLNWTDNANNESGFEIDRSLDGKTSWQNVGSTSTDGESFVDTTVTPGIKYFYRVHSIGQYGESPFTTPVSAKAWGVAPAPAVSTPQAEVAAPAVDASPATTPVTVVSKIAWTQLTGAAQSPVGRTEAETATVNGKIYCFGGYTDSTLVPMAVSAVFDPGSNTWSPLPNMPVGTTHAGTATDGRYIYMAGGYTPGPNGNGGAGNQSFANANVYRFDTQTNAWSKIQALPAPRGAGMMVLLDRTLHFVGGTDLARKDQTTHWSLNLDDPNATWQTETPMITARNHLGAVVLNSKIYAIAGQENQDPNFTTIGNVEIWDPADPAHWTTGAPLPVTRSHIAGATFVYDGQIILMGGDHTYLHDVSNVSSYNPITNKWTDLTPLPIGRESGCGTVINDVFYYMTGNISKACYKGVLTISNPVTPAVPTEFTVSNVQSFQATLNWSETSTQISGFSIQVSTDDASWGTPINVGNVNTKVITGLLPNQAYYFRISANNSGATSDFAIAGPITTLDGIAPPTTVIVDDPAALLAGGWTVGNSTAGFYGADYVSDGNTAKGTKTATFTPNLTAAAGYQVFARWTAAASRATNVPFDIVNANGTTTVIENQRINGGTWISLGTFQFNGGTAGNVTIRTTGTNGYVIADAVEFVPTGAAVATTVIVDDTAAAPVGNWTSGNTTSGFYNVDYLSDGNTAKGTKSVTFTPNLTVTGTYNVYARWTAAPSRATNVPFDIVHQGTTTTVTANQQQNGGVWVLLGTFTFDAGLTSSVTIRTTGTNGYVIADAVEFVPA